MIPDLHVEYQLFVFELMVTQVQAIGHLAAFAQWWNLDHMSAQQHTQEQCLI